LSKIRALAAQHAHAPTIFENWQPRSKRNVGDSVRFASSNPEHRMTFRLREQAPNKFEAL
jgi:hypothetical protein